MTAVSTSDLIWRSKEQQNSQWRRVPRVPSEGFWTKRKVTIAATIGTTLVIAALAAVLFSPIGPLAGVGLWLLAAFAGKLGLGALVTAIALPVSFVLPTALVAIGIAIDKHLYRWLETREEIVHASRKIALQLLQDKSPNAPKPKLNPCMRAIVPTTTTNPVVIQFTPLTYHDDYSDNDYDLNAIRIYGSEDDPKKLFIECDCWKNRRKTTLKFNLARSSEAKVEEVESSQKTKKVRSQEPQGTQENGTPSPSNGKKTEHLQQRLNKSEGEKTEALSNKQMPPQDGVLLPDQ
jgi:hypothetical protein